MGVLRVGIGTRWLAAAAAASLASLAAAQMPSPKEIEEALREMQRALENLPPELRKMAEDAQRRLANSPGAGDEVRVPARDAARIAKVPRQPLYSAQL